jgi:hypothetical protein
MQRLLIFNLADWLTAISTFGLLIVTGIYACLTRSIVKSQKAKPEIRFVGISYPRPDPFLAQVTVAVANPSMRSTSVRIVEVTINSSKARNSTCYYGGKTMQQSVTIPQGGLIEVTIDAEFNTTPLEMGAKNNVEIELSDIFSGRGVVKGSDR